MGIHLKIVTFNMRTDHAADGANAFKKRRDGINHFLHKEPPDILCCQELTPTMADAITPELPGYYFIGCGREANFSGERCSIAYKNESLKLIKAETFWLSDTPDKEGSRFKYQSSHPRICTVLWLSPCSGRAKKKLIRVYNTHLDHVDEYARIMGLTLIMRHMEEKRNRPELPTILTGDFNALPNSEPIKMIEQTIRPELVDITKNLDGTFHDYGKKNEKIDYIFTDRSMAKDAKNVNLCHGEQENEGLYLSDHYPVEALLYV